MSAPTYQVILTDRAGSSHGTIPPNGLTYERRLGGSGAASVRCRLDHPVIAGTNLDAWATELDVLRNDDPRFSGPVVDPAGDGVDGYVTITAAAATQWLSRRLVLRDLEYAATDQADVLAALVAYAQDTVEKGPNADARLLVAAAATGVLRDRTYLGAERAQVGDLVQNLVEVLNGFDLTLELSKVGSEVLRILTAHYPSAGVDVDVPLVLGRGLTSLTVKRPGDQVATRVLAVGNGEGSDQVTAVATAAAALEERYGVHELPLSLTDVKEQTTLQSHADGLLALRQPPLLVVGASYRVTEATPYGLADLGDRVLVQADRGWLQLDERLRVIAEKVTVGPNGSESVDLTFNTALEAA